MDEASVDQILARLQSKADVARKNTADAAAAARGKPRVSEDMASESAVRENPGLNVPQPTSAEPYEFEKGLDSRTVAPDHGIPTGTDLHSDPNMGETRVNPLTDDPSGVNEMPTEVHNPLAAAKADADRVMAESTGRLKAKAQSRAMPQPENPAPKSIEQLAQEDAERILGKKPMGPPEIGTMEDKPVESVVDSRGKDLANAVETPEGKILTTAEDAAQLQSKIPAATAIEETTEGIVKRAAGGSALARSNMANRLAGRLGAQEARATYEAPSLASKVASAVRSNAGKAGTFAAEHPTLTSAGKFTGQLVKGVGSELVSPITGLYKGVSEGMTGWQEAGMLGKGYRLARAGIGGAIGGGTAALRLGAEAALPAVMAAEGGMIANKLGYGSEEDYGKPNENPGLAGAREQQIQNLKDYNATANKYGLKVTGNTSTARMLLYGGPNIKVQEDPTLKAAYLAQNKARIHAMQDSWLNNQAKGHSE